MAAEEQPDPAEEDASSTPPAASAPALAVRAAGREPPPPLLPRRRRPFRFLLLTLQRLLRPVSAVARRGGEDGALAGWLAGVPLPASPSRLQCGGGVPPRRRCVRQAGPTGLGGPRRRGWRLSSCRWRRQGRGQEEGSARRAGPAQRAKKPLRGVGWAPTRPGGGRSAARLAPAIGRRELGLEAEPC